MNVADKKTKLTVSRWSIAAAIFGGVSNLLSWVLENYQFYYLEHLPVRWNFSLFFTEVISLAPVLVLFVMRQVSSVIFTYAFLLFLILVWRVQHIVPYNFLGTGAVSYKIDMPGLLLLFLGVISAIVILVMAVIRLLIFVRRAQASSGSAS